MATGNHYVDPSIDMDMGTGTAGDPYGDLQYALDQASRGGDGDIFHIKAGTAEVLTGDISFATFGSPSNQQPILFQGYTSIAGDGGIGEIDGDGAYVVFPSQSFLHYKHLKIGNVGGRKVADLTSSQSIVACEIHGNTGTNPIVELTGNGGSCIGCYVRNGTYRGIATSGNNCKAFYNYIKNDGTNKFDAGIWAGGYASIVGNVINIDSDTNGIDNAEGSYCSILFNSIYSNGGTGIGIDFGTSFYIAYGNNCFANAIEGFSGTGGIGIKATATLYPWNATASSNAIYNCATAYDIGDHADLCLNETLSASPFTDAANEDFTPVDTGDMHSPPDMARPDVGNIQNLCKGATQRSGGTNTNIFLAQRRRVFA